MAWQERRSPPSSRGGGGAFPKPLARDQKGNRPIYPGGLSGIADREDLVHKHLLCTSEAFTPVHPPQFEDQNREEAAAAAGVPEPEPEAPLLRLPLAFCQRTKKPSKFREVMIPTEQIGMFLCPPFGLPGVISKRRAARS